MAGYAAEKKACMARLKRAEGQVRGLQRMVEGDAYCLDVLTQVSAITKALQAVALGLMDDHLGHCVAAEAAEGRGAIEVKVREAAEAIAQLVHA
ncbi:MAG: metal-sensitive transcriptional regulator [Streptomycetaceae bacterium]|jgi:DNA-binding FrmR family transcriptional regulator|nr:metal-sensitive transcriptional regulator [Streptomycetaceae bacterium]